MELNLVIITAAVGALTGVAAAFFKSSIDYRKEVRSELWNKRYESYTKIWKLTQLIPRWPKNELLTYKALYDMSRHCQDWYFQDGGILLSESGRKKYGKMQEAITVIRSRHDSDQAGSVVPEDYETVLSACSLFRGAITSELLSRKTTK